MGNGDYFARVVELGRVRSARLANQPSDRAIAETVKLSPTTVGNWFRGSSFPSSVDLLIAAIEVVRADAAQQGKLDADLILLLDKDAWRTAYEVEARRRADKDSVSANASRARSALAGLAPGKPISEYVADPLRLEVHKAIELAADLTELPFYVPRQHDNELAEVVDGVKRGQNAIAVLVGGSSTGKTRACWEAVRELGGEWRLWHPINPGRVEALLGEIDRVGPRTVLWLNEIHHYLTPAELGEQAAARLRHLLGESAPGHILVLGTTRREHWRTLTAEVASGEPDPHSQARELLTGHGVEVPAKFARSELDALEKVVDRDPRLAKAAAEAIGGEITQYLAGAPALIERYRTVSAPAQALIRAAIDARRLGVGEAIPLDLLVDAVPGYLTEVEWNDTTENWIEEALAEVSAPCKGVPGPLTRPKPRRRRVAPTSHYKLADYLEQFGAAERAAELPPTVFWEAAAEFADPSDQKRLGYAAGRFGFYQQEAQLLKNALLAGENGGAIVLLDRIAGFDPTAVPQLLQWLVDHLSAAGPYTVAFLVDELLDRGLRELAVPFLTRAVTDAHLHVPGVVAGLLAALTKVDAEVPVQALLARKPADHVPLDDISDVVASKLRLRELGADHQAAELARRFLTARRLDGIWLLPDLRDLAPPEEVRRFADMLVGQVNVAEATTVSNLLLTLNEIDAVTQIQRLIARDVVSKIDLTDSFAVCVMLNALQGVAAVEQLSDLIDRVAAHAVDATPNWMAELHMMARELSVGDEIVTRLPRGLPPGELDLADRLVVPLLVQAWNDCETDEDRFSLVDRTVAALQALDDVDAVAEVLNGLASTTRKFAEYVVAESAARLSLADGRLTALLIEALIELDQRDDIDSLVARNPAGTVALHDPRGVGDLLTVLHNLGYDEQVARLFRRDVVNSVRLIDIQEVLRLLDTVERLGLHPAVTALAARVADEADLSGPSAVLSLLQSPHIPKKRLLERDPVGALVIQYWGSWASSPIAGLLRAFHAMRAADQVQALAERTAVECDLKRLGTSTNLAAAMREVGAEDQVETLAKRAASSGAFDLYLRLKPQEAHRFKFGRELDGVTPSSPWGWQDLD